MEYFPLTQEQVIAKGYKRKEEEDKQFQGQAYLPLPIDQYNETNIPELLNGILKCEINGRPFRIIQQELKFYIKHQLPIPTKHPDIRHLERMNKRNPRKLRDRKCAKCSADIKTSYAPERPEIVYCEQCYNKEIY